MKGDGDNAKGENSNDKDSKKNSEQAEMNAISAEVEATIKSGNQSAIDALKAKLQRVQGLGSIGVGVASNMLEGYVDKEKEEEQRNKQSRANISSSPAPSYTNYQENFNTDPSIKEDSILLGTIGVVVKAENLVEKEIRENLPHNHGLNKKDGLKPKGIDPEVLEGLKSGGATRSASAKELAPPSKDPKTFGEKPLAKESGMIRNPAGKL